jgi:hypothetical protein
MTSENVLSTLFNNIADAIRAKTGSTAMMKPAEFLKQIRNINSSNGDNSDNDDNSGDPPIMFTFYIENTGYYAIHGMTWGEWCGSEFDTSGYAWRFYVPDDVGLGAHSYMAIDGTHNTIVKWSDAIVSDLNYNPYWVGIGGSN